MRGESAFVTILDNVIKIKKIEAKAPTYEGELYNRDFLTNITNDYEIYYTIRLYVSELPLSVVTSNI